MRAVWAGSPANARDVLERVEAATGWAYTTVKTLLQRLVDKGALQVHKHRNTSVYAAVLQPVAARRSALQSLLRSAFEGSFGTLLQHLVADQPMSAADRRQLASLLADQPEPRARPVRHVPPAGSATPRRRRAR